MSLRSITKAKMLVGAVLAVLALGTLVGLFYLKISLDQQAGAAAGEIAVTVSVLDENATALYTQSVRGANLSALSALLAAAQQGGFEVETQDSSFGVYVTAIAGRAATGSGGWVYEIGRDGQTLSGDRAATDYFLAEGDALVWKWAMWEGG